MTPSECGNSLGDDDREPDLCEQVSHAYEQAREPFSVYLYETTLHGLVESGQVKRRKGRCECEEHWRLAPRAEDASQLVMFV